MAIKLNENYVKGFISDAEISNIQPMITTAHNLLRTKQGPGNDFLGWVTLPFDYDKAEFEAIKASAEKIKKSCDVFIVIGIGGSYLGARAAIEFVKSPVYNNMKKDTPDIYFSGCLYIPLSEVVDLDKERARLSEQMKKNDSEIERIEKKLSNEGFVSKAPAAVIEGERAKLAKYLETKEALKAAIAKLG